MREKQSFYGWVVAVGAFFIMAMPFAIVFLAHSVFLRPVTEARGFSLTEFSFVFTIVAVTTAVTSPFMGRLIHKVDIRYVMAICGAVVSIAFSMLGFATSLWHFYGLAAILGIFATGVTQIPIANIITNWFPCKSKGVATGIAFAGGNVGSFITVLIASRLIPTIGYQRTYFIFGGTMLIVTIFVSIFIIRSKPADKGQLPYGMTQAEGQGSNLNVRQDMLLDGDTLKEVKKTTVFWVFIVAIILLGVVFAGIQTHIPSYMQSVGHSMKFASIVTSIVAITGIISNVCIGVLLEKGGLRLGLTIVGMFMVLSVMALLLGARPAFAVTFAVLFGLFASIASMGPSYLTSQMFGRKDYGSIFGFVMMFFQLGGAVGPTFSGFIYDRTGGYTITWFIYIGLLVATFATFLMSVRLMKKGHKRL